MITISINLREIGAKKKKNIKKHFGQIRFKPCLRHGYFLLQSSDCMMSTFSVTRFGEIVPIWYNFKSLGQKVRVYLVFGKMLILLRHNVLPLGNFSLLQMTKHFKIIVAIWSQCRESCCWLGYVSMRIGDTVKAIRLGVGLF